MGLDSPVYIYIYIYIYKSMLPTLAGDAVEGRLQVRCGVGRTASHRVHRVVRHGQVTPPPAAAHRLHVVEHVHAAPDKAEVACHAAAGAHAPVGGAAHHDDLTARARHVEVLAVAVFDGRCDRRLKMYKALKWPI